MGSVAGTLRVLAINRGKVIDCRDASPCIEGYALKKAQVGIKRPYRSDFFIYNSKGPFEEAIGGISPRRKCLS